MTVINGQEVFTLDEMKAIVKEGGSAFNSKYFGQVMTDGNIFNPYLHRRYISRQFLELIKDTDITEDSLMSVMYNAYDLTYMYKFVVEEVGKLAMLERTGNVAFDERCVVFTPNMMGLYISRYIDYVKEHLLDDDNVKRLDNNRYIFRLHCIGETIRIIVQANSRASARQIISRSSEYLVLKQELEKLSQKLSRRQEDVLTFNMLNRVLQGHNLPLMTKSQDRRAATTELYDQAKEVYVAFYGTGLYFTVKNSICYYHTRFVAQENDEALNVTQLQAIFNVYKNETDVSNKVHGFVLLTTHLKASF